MFFRSKPVWEILKHWNRWKPVTNHLRKQLETIRESFEDSKEKVLPVPESNYMVSLIL